MGRLTGVLGIAAILLFAYLFSTDRKAIRVKTIWVGLTLQFIFAILILRVGYGERVMTTDCSVTHSWAQSFSSADWAASTRNMA
jgi:nucleoside permease NupC